jgi:ribosome-associated translation inhibitor RaiA
MQLRVSSADQKLKETDIDRIQRDLEKIDRRLNSFREVFAELRINGGNNGGEPHHATLEVRYGRTHLIAKADHPEMGQAVRAARDEILRQIKDRSRGSHSQYAKGR